MSEPFAAPGAPGPRLRYEKVLTHARVAGVVAAVLTSGCMLDKSADYFEPEAAQATPLRPGRVVRVEVVAKDGWQSTGVSVRRGEPLHVEATGSVVLNKTYFPSVGPDGVHLNHSIIYPSFLHGALLGRIGRDGPPFLIGSDLQWAAGQTGVLYMRLNDSHNSDNEGVLTATITTDPGEAPSRPELRRSPGRSGAP